MTKNPDQMPARRTIQLDAAAASCAPDRTLTASNGFPERTFQKAMDKCGARQHGLRAFNLEIGFTPPSYAQVDSRLFPLVNVSVRPARFRRRISGRNWFKHYLDAGKWAADFGKPRPTREIAVWILPIQVHFRVSMTDQPGNDPAGRRCRFSPCAMCLMCRT